jgi:hypothetical protein
MSSPKFDEQAYVKKVFDNHEKILDKLDLLHDKIHGIEKVQIRQEADLREHMSRTAMNEERIEHFEEEIRPLLESLRASKMVFSFLAFVVSAIALAIRFFH